ncbi:hypothetical protein Ate02nite_85630 [Paractinoplanes tereljensis]|uniref:Uncharacterized protein n=1 Tax=Paractinoplanes tereljensis TaxID=571912 RepID=A0A919TWD3_9ACTN|nr:hypothetical protein Ate02nite_85630 [Actinoplanes tereljensis]
MGQTGDPPGLEPAEEGRVVGGQVGGAGVHPAAVQVLTGQTAADKVTSFDHPGRKSGIDQLTGTGETGDPGSDDNDGHA